MRVNVVVVVSAVAAVVAAPAVAAGRSGGRTTCSDSSTSPQLAIPRTTLQVRFSWCSSGSGGSSGRW